MGHRLAVLAGVLVLALATGCTQDPAGDGAATASQRGRAPGALGAPSAPTPEPGPPPRRHVAVAIHGDAPPGAHVGLERVPVVVEYVLADGRPGWLALGGHDIEVMGPLRSATPSDAALALAFHADLAVARTTGDVVNSLRSAGLTAFEEHTVAGTLLRDARRRAPYNLYAAPSRIGAHVDDGDASRQLPAGDGQPGTAQPRDEVMVPLGADLTVTWTWDPAAGRWLRTTGARLDETASGERIGAATVVLLEAPRLDRPPVAADLVGSGPAAVLRDGTLLRTTWERPDASALPRVDGLGPTAADDTVWLHICAHPCVPGDSPSPSPARPR